jgi:hypothetical protein
MYLEVIGQVYGDAQKVIIDQKAGGGQGVVPYLPLPEIQKRKRKNADDNSDAAVDTATPDTNQTQ